MPPKKSNIVNSNKNKSNNENKNGIITKPSLFSVLGDGSDNSENEKMISETKSPKNKQTKKKQTPVVQISVPNSQEVANEDEETFYKKLTVGRKGIQQFSRMRDMEWSELIL
jgi:hypothetical protein